MGELYGTVVVVVMGGAPAARTEVATVAAVRAKAVNCIMRTDEGGTESRKAVKGAWCREKRLRCRIT